MVYAVEVLDMGYVSYGGVARSCVNMNSVLLHRWGARNTYHTCRLGAMASHIPSTLKEGGVEDTYLPFTSTTGKWKNVIFARDITT